MLGIPETHCLDIYGMSELTQYCHVPRRALLPSCSVDEALRPRWEPTPVGYEKVGRFAFLDPLAYSYPGFVMTGDKVRLLSIAPSVIGPDPSSIRSSDGPSP